MKSIAVLSLAIAALAVAGCSEKNTLGTVKIAGQVLVDGEPMDGITVTFRPRGNGKLSGVGRTDAKGQFALTTGGAPVNSGVVPGEYDVIFYKVSYDDASGSGGRVPPKPKYLILPKYENPRSSGIEPVTVVNGKNSPFNFELLSKE